MPEFDKDLNPIALNESSELPTLPSPGTPMPSYRPSFYVGRLGDGGGAGGDGKTASAFDKYFSAGAVPTELLPTVSVGELHANRRYDKYSPYMIDIEDQFSQSQSDWSKAFNGITKGAGLAGTTVLGLGGLLYGGAKSLLFTHKFSDVYNNEVTRELDDFNTNMDEYWMPNYYSNAEKNAKWYSPDNWFKTNFLFDKLIKNAGYAVGAVYSGNIIGAGLKAAGLGLGAKAMQMATRAEASQAFKMFTPLLRNTARAFSVGKNAEAASILQKEISNVADVEATASAIADISKTTNAFQKFNDVGRRSVTAFLSQAGESSFEALQTAKEFRNNLIEEYKATHNGFEPTGDDLNKINETANSVGNTSFLGNMAILGITEFTQLPRLLGSSYAADKRAANSLLGETSEVVKRGGKYVAAGPTTRFGKIYEKTARVGGFIFDPKEAAQELSQYALQVGTQNYFKKAEESKDANLWTDLVMYGLMGTDEKRKGVGALVSKEGMESMVLGGITGGFMQTFGPYGKIARGKAIKSNTETFLNQIDNAPTFKEAFKDRIDSANRGIVLQKQQQDAVMQGDKLEAKDLDADMLHNYLSTRIKYGRFDMVMGDLADLRQQGSTEKGLTSLKQEGFANVNDTIESYRERLTNIETVAKNTNEIYKAYDLMYSGEVLKDDKGNPILDADGRQQRKYSPLVIDKMVYAASKIADYDLRIPSVNLALAEAGVLTQDVINSIIKDGKPNKEATAKALNDINDLNVIDTVKDELKTSLSDVIELSLRRKLFVDEHNDIKNNPLNYDILPGYEFGKDVMDKTPVDVVQKELDAEDKVKETTKKLQIGKEYSLKESIMKDGAKLMLAPKITVLSQTLGGELEVKLPNGKTTFLAPEEFKKYEISDEDNTSQELADILDGAIDTVLEEDKYADVKREMPKVEDGKKLDKVGWVNSLDNQSLIDDIESEFQKQASAAFEERERKRKEAEELKRKKEQINKEQEEIETRSGTVNTGDPTKETWEEEGFLKDAYWLFTSGTTESEDLNDPTESSAHIKRSRQFFRNTKNLKNRRNLRAIVVTAKQVKALGLEGIVQLSFKKDLTSDVNDIKIETGSGTTVGVNDVNNGFVAQVFTVQEADGLYFVDENGEKISKVGEKVDLNRVIFQTMPTTSLFYNIVDKKGNPVPRYRKDQKEIAEQLSKAWSVKRADLFAAPENEYTVHEFMVSRGIRVPSIMVNGVRQKHHVGVTLINEDAKEAEKVITSQQGLIIIPTKDTISHNGRLFKVPKGRPLLQYGDTLEFLSNKKFSPSQAKSIFEVLKAMADETLAQSKAGKEIKFNRSYSLFLQNVLFWVKGTTTSGNQMYIDESNLYLGGKAYSLVDFANNESAIIDQLTETYNNVNNKSLTEFFTDPFVEYYFEDGQLKDREWKNYQSYLLSSKTPDGKARNVNDTPLATDIPTPSDSVPYTHKQKYAILIGMELPISKVAPTPQAAPQPTPTAPTGARKIGEYTEGVENTIALKQPVGDTPFSFTINEKNQVEVNVIETPAINEIANDPAKREPFFNALKAYNRFDATKENAELILDFVAFRIAGQLQGMLDEQLKAQTEAPAATPTTPTPAPTAPVSDKKAEITAKLEEKQKELEVAANNKDKDKYKAALLEINKLGEELAALEGAKPAEEQTKKSAKTQLRFAKVGDVLYDARGNKYEVLSKKDKYGRSLEYRKNDKELGAINPKTVGPYDNPFAIEDLYYEKPGTSEEQTKTDPNKFNGFDGPSGDFRAMAPGERGGMTAEELELFKQWHAANVPFIPYEILENIIKTADGKRAWGVFENGVAKFVRGGLRGTEYHEVFEGIWKAFLTEDQRQELIAEFRAKKGQFLDRESGKKIDYAEATNKQVKERIADDFSEFRLGKLPARSLGEKIRNFFKAIMDFFKSFVSKPSLKEQLFKAIDTGKFKEFTVSETVKNEAAEYRAVEGLTEQQTHEFVEDMTARAAGILFKEADKKTLFSPEGITSRDMFAQIEQMYSIEKNSQGFSKRELLSDNAWKELQTKTKQYLRTLGINFNEEDKVNINDENYDNRLYAAEPFSTDWKKSSPFAIKFTLATLLKTVASNQKGVLQFDLPKADTNDIGYKLINFSRAFATLLDKMSNTTSVTKAVEKLIDLASNDTDYVRLFRRLGGVTTREGQSFIQFDNFEQHDWRLFINFMQVFTKQKPEAIIQYRSEGDVYSRPADLFSAAKEVERSWMENLKALSLDKDSIVWLDRSEQKYKVNRAPLQGIDISKPQFASAFLSEIGVRFGMDTVMRMKEADLNKFLDAVGQIYSYLGSNDAVASIKGSTLGISGPIAELSRIFVKVTNPNQENTHFNIEGQRTQNYADNNATSVFENTFNESETLEELLEKMPQLNDTFSTNSQVLKKGGLFFDEEGKRIRKIKVKTIEGTKIVDKNKGIASAKLNIGDRFVQEINENLMGNYYVLVPADSSTEWMMDLGNTISFIDIDSGRAWTKIYKAFTGYLMDDVSLALDWKNREKLNNVKARAKELRFFKDILNDKDLEEINSLVNRGATLEEIEQYINDNTESINASIKSYIDATVENTTNILKSNNKIITTEKGFKYPDLIDSFALSRNVGINKNNMSETDVNNLITFANVNYIINNIEYHKIIFGDPFQFAIKEKDGKIILDETKRIKSFLSPRKTTFDHPLYNNFLNREYNKAGQITLDSTDPGYHNHKPYTNTVTFEDVNIAGSLANIIPAYGKVNEADAASWLMDGTYREIKLKNGQWSDEAEAWHQWQMAWTRQNMPSYVYKNSALEKQDKEMISKPAPKHTIEELKPIVSGVKYGKSNIDLVLDKFSQMPIYYSMVKGTNLEKLYLQMMNQGVGYAIVESGRKVGAEGKQKLYNSDGSFNDNVFNNNVQVPWTAYGIQVENSYEGEKQQTRGSQLTKLSSMDLYSNGQASDAAKKEYERNKRILDEMHQNAYTELLERLGIEDTGNGFILPTENNKSVSEVLVYEMLRRRLSDNAIDTVQVDENNQFRIPFEASPSYVQIRDILYSMIDKTILSPKMNGGAHVQVPSTMFESATKGRSLVEKTKDGWKKITRQEYENLSDERKKNVVLTDDTLKFYTEKDPYCEVMLPHWFGEKLMKTGKFKTDKALLEYLNTTAEGKKILTGIGFRIPTQALSSVEVFRVKGFLPQYMGATVVVPSEITTKSGSDFDIDKLNMYLKSVYIDKNGDIKLIEYKDSEEATKEFFGKVFDEKLEKTKVKKAELFEAAQILIHGLDDPNNLVERYSDLLDSILDSYEDASDFEASIMSELQELGDKELQIQLKTRFVKDMYKKALENEYYDSLEKMITLPENFRRLITPVDDAGLKDIAEKLDDLRGYNESNIKNRVLDRNYMTSLRHAFTIAKRWVGIAAVNITGHSLAQKVTLFIDPKKIEQLPKKDKALLKDGSVILPHNKVTINGEEYISLSGKMDATGKFYISDGLSGYATTFVDVAKDPYIMKIITSDLSVGTFMFLQRIGVPLETSAMFMNQPIIKKYLEILDSRASRNIFDMRARTAVKALFADTTDELISETTVDLTALEGNIKKYYAGEKLSPSENAQQQRILEEFLKYAKMAEFNFKFTQSVNYDTSKFRSAENLFKKESLTDRAIETNIISSPSKVLEKSFIGGQKKILNLLADGMGAILKLDKYEFRVVTNDVVRKFAEKEFFSNDDYVKVANKVKTSFLDFIVQTKTGLNKEVESLLVNAGTSVAAKLENAKKEHPEIKILQDLQVVSSDRIDGAKAVKLNVNVKDAYDENMYTGMMRELRDNPATTDLYYDIIYSSLLQSTYRSAISIRNIIPIEDFSETVAPIISSLVSDESVEAFAKENWFERNNWEDDAVVGTVSPAFFFPMNRQTGDIFDSPIGVDASGNEIFQYSSPSYIDIKDLGVLGTDRKILLLGEKYNMVDVQSDIIKVPRVIESRTGDKMDVMTGRTITPSAFYNMKKKGDISYRDYLGYKKVRDAYGNPVIASVDKDGNATYVYKLINLYGDGMYASEYYSDFRPSPINNGTIKIEQEIPDADIIAYYGNNTSAQQVAAIQSTPSAITAISKVGPEFDQLPGKSAIPTMTYAGIGSRETPPEILAQMTEIAKELEAKGYTLRSGGAQGADTAFEKGVSTKKEIFPGGKKAGEREMRIAREIHPNPQALDNSKNPAFVWNLMARNTNQVFGDNLDTPVDFVIAWTQDALTDYRKRSIKSGGTGQAIDMASRKGIPVINMANPNWREQLNRVLSAPKEAAVSAQPQAEVTPEIVEAKPGQPTPTIFESRNVQIDYTAGQRQALSDVQSLIDANKQGYYLLAGYAGTGKTTIAENIARYAQLKGRTAVVLAPTNKAAKVLNDKLESAGVNSEATTIHKAIYGEPDPVTGEWIPGSTIKNSVLIIDESSMISKDVMRDLIDNTDNNNVLIFMGDSFQLEPVGEDSGLFKGKVEQVRDSQTELTEVKRQSLDSNVLKVATVTRTDGKPYVPETTIQDFKVSKSKAEFVEDFKSAIRNNEDAVVIVATNSERIAMNNIARQEKFGDKKAILNNGDVMISVANSNFYPNSEMFEVSKINDSVKKQITVTTKDGKSSTYDVFFTDVETRDGKNITMAHIPLLDKPSLYHAQMMEYAKKDGDFMRFLGSKLLVVPTKKGLKLSASLVIATYGYSVTAHKSQGSQWSKVFVNQNYVSPSWNSARWYYTAITRSSKDVIVLNTGNNIKISEADMNKKLNVSSSQEASTKSIQPKPEIPAYIVNNALQNADGTKRFAQTNGKQIILNPVNNPQEFFDYFEGKEGGPTSLQKQKVLDSLAKAGWPIERIKATLATNKLINTFLILHEQSHIDNNDKDVYWLNGKDLMTDDKIAIETRASLDALNKLSLDAQQEFPDKSLNVENKKCNG